jgi:hypothetical protein
MDKISKSVASDYIADSMAICLMLKIRYDLKDFVKNKVYPNNVIEGNRTINKPYFWHEIKLQLTKHTDGKPLFNGLTLDSFILKLKDKELLYFAEKFKLLSNQYTNEELITSLRTKYSF